MKSLGLLVVLTVLSICASAQTNNSQPPTHRDSVRERFLDHGAWLHPLFSRERAMYIDSAIALSHDDAYLWQQRAMPYFKQMKYEVGMPYLDSAVKYDSMMWLDYRAFIKCIFSKQYREAIQDFRAAQRQRPTAGVMDHEYNFYLGLSYLQLCQYDSAESLFSTCIRHDGEAGKDWVHYMHMFYIGIAQYEEQRYGAAVLSFDRAIESYPHFADAKYYKVRCMMALDPTNPPLALMIEGRDDIKNGLTINEDNAVYEKYPYQIGANAFDDMIVQAQKHLGRQQSQ
ncbi:MAG: hypothetical protein Q8922_06160 [Bacteroidota bacterium]|nr:hypothetical protein [Bacteroidota bacterium]MDP4233741.1 hypothetical protein [Bacteroidota bacterium]MDP4242380.1 hypothetical protein [Bacteroidota bacterium]MDP4287502.1 hypothetical protein [Bacteroidota bacterium]